MQLLENQELILLKELQGLHFKSSVTYLGKNYIISTKEFSKVKELDEFKKIILTSDEEYAGNILNINNHLIMPKGFDSVKEKLEILELPIIELDTSESRKLDGALTCLSLRF